MKNRLDLVIARLDEVCSEVDDDSDGALWDENEHERRARLFK